LHAQAESLRALAEDYARGARHQERALVVALVGATGAGKSTLLNALVGAQVAAPGEQRPTTERAVVYAPHDAQLGALSSVESEVVRYQSGGGPWSGQVFVDTPDLNSVASEHRERAQAVLEQADVALVVLHKGSVAEAVQAQFLRPFATRRRLLFVLNHADLLAEPAREQLKAQAKQIAEERLGLADPEVYAVSALRWLQDSGDVGERGALLAALRGLGQRATAERIRRSNALGALRELQGQVGAALSEAEQAGARQAALVAAGMGQARPMVLDDLQARLDSAAAHLGHAVREEAARRLWGPAGWWMRLTLFGGSGLGAAALLARGHPLVASGLALGAAVASRVQKASLAHAAQRQMVADAGGGEVFELAARTALAAARTQAAQRGAPEQVGLPTVEALAQELGALRAWAWAGAVGEGLPDAVRGWWRVARFALLPLVNLPLLALFAHVAYRVVEGYLQERYVGLDFLLNASAFALVLAGAGGALASLTLMGLRRKVMADARARLSRGWEQLSARLQADVREGDRPALLAARALCAQYPEP
jgi:energy-coupling factor transporter ATP-binding protein EcfA2